MAITKQKKVEILGTLAGVTARAKTLVFAGFKGLTVAEQNEMRKALRAQGVGYMVAKKSLMRRVFDATKYGGAIPPLEGEVALAYGEDELAPAREVAVFVKKFPEHLRFLGGVFGGAFVSKEEITSIAAIPGLQALRAQFVQLINSPRPRLAVILNKYASQKSSAPER